MSVDDRREEKVRLGLVMASSGDGWDAQKMLDLYLHDYMVRRKMYKAAEIFGKEVGVGTNPVVIDSPDGFLHEWWTIFYDVFCSRQQKHQETKAKAPIRVEQMTEFEQRNSHLPLPQLTTDQQRSGQCSSGTDFHKMLAQQPSCLWTRTRFEEEQRLRHLDTYFDLNLQLLDLNKLNLRKSAATSSRYPQQHIRKQPEQLTMIDKRSGISSGRENSVDPAFYSQGCLLNGSGYTELGGVNSTLLDAWLLNSLTHVPNRRQQLPPLIENCQQHILVESMSLASVDQASAFPGCSADFNIPNLSNTNATKAQMTAQMKQNEVQKCQHHRAKQQPAESNRKGKKQLCLKAEDKPSVCAAAVVEKPLDENVESFLSNDEEKCDKGIPLRNLKRHCTDCSKDDHKEFSFEEVGCLCSSKTKVLCCHFSSDGKVLASAGHEKKVSIWQMDTFDFIKSSEGHSLLITDVRFRPSSPILATSSFDRTVQIWNSEKLGRSLFKLVGHNEQVMSLDFHPRRADQLCSCDTNDEIRLWNVNYCSCLRIYKGATKQIRFQPQSGKLLATASGNEIKILDTEIDGVQFTLKGHTKDVQSICWDTNGKYIASVSEDSARLWSVASGGSCVHELHPNGNKFQSCAFHPGFSQLLIIGGYQSLEIWNPTGGDKTWSVPAHGGLISSLACSTETEMVASTSHDQCVKLWK